VPPLWFDNLLAASVQITLLVISAALLVGAFRLREPRVLLRFWTALLAACLLLPVLEPWRTVAPMAGAAVTVRTGAIEILRGAAQPAKHWPFSVYQVIAFTLVAGMVVRLIGVGLGLLRLRQYRRKARPLAPLPDSVKEMLTRTRAHAGFCLSHAVDSPVTFGLSRPLILLPERFLDFEARRQATIACHELVHVRRDDWARHLAEEFPRALFWFHPAILWLIARIRLAREQVVDLDVLAFTGARQPYLEALLEIAAGRSLARAGQIVPAPPFLAENQLAERVMLMLKEVSMSKTRLIASLAAILGSIALVGALAVSSFPLKAMPHTAVTTDAVAAQSSHPDSSRASTTTKSCDASAPGCPKGGVVGGVVGGVDPGIAGGITAGAVDGIVSGVSGEIAGRISSGIVRGVVTGVAAGVIKGAVGGVPDGVGGGIGGGVGRGVVTGVPGGVSTGIPGGVRGGVPGEARVEPAESGGADDVSAPKLEHAVPPEYPPLAKMARIEGDVILNATIDEDGKVTNLEVASGHPLLLKAALDAVRQWKYEKPAIAPLHFDVTVHFELPKQTESKSAEKEATKAYEPAAAVEPVTTAKEYVNKALSASEKRQASSLKLVRTVDPVYPPDAKATHIQGNVVLSVTVDKNGKVSNIEVLSGPEQLVKSAIDAVEQWEYEPPNIAPAVTTVTVNFTLGNGVAQPAYKVGGDVSAPKPIFKPEPPYTDKARKDKVQGTVQLLLVVDAEGKVSDAKVVKALDPGLDASALRTVRTWQFQPATRDGKPVPVKVTVEVDFRLYHQ